MSGLSLFRLCWLASLLLTVSVCALAQSPSVAVVRERSLRSFPARLRYDLRSGKLVLADDNQRRPTDVVTRRQPFKNGSLRLVAQATGISQMIESGVTSVRFGQFTSNGQRLFSNVFEMNGVPANLGLLADDSTIAAGLGGLPALTASGGLQPSLQVSGGATAVVQAMDRASIQRTGGATISSTLRGGTNNFHGSFFENFGHERFNANDPFAKTAGFERAPARLNSFGGVFNGKIVEDRGWFFVRYSGLRLRQPAFLVNEVPDAAARTSANADIRRFLSAFPFSNGGPTGNGLAFFRSNTSNPADADEFSMIADTRISDGWRTNLAYSLTRSAAAVRGEAGASASTVATTENRYDSIHGNLDGSVSSSLRINVTGSYSTNRIRRGYESDNFAGAESLQRNSFAFQRFELPGSSAALMSSDEFTGRVRQFVLSENTVLVKNSWFFDIGGDLRYLSFRPGAPATERRILFIPQNSPVSMLATRISDFSRDFPRDPSATDFSFYANARYSNSNFSTSFGLRADNERVAAAPLAVGANLNSGVNLAPRAAITYYKWDSAFRVGTGLYYDYRTPYLSEFFVTAAPFLRGRSDRLVSLNTQPVTVLPTGFSVDPNFRTPRVWHSFGEVTRRLTNRQHVSVLLSLSRASSQIRSFLNPELNSPSGFTRTLTSDGRSESEAIDVTYSTTFELLRIWSRYSLRRTRDDFPADSLRNAVVRSRNSDRDFGASDFDVRHQFSTIVSYRLPFFFTKGWKKKLNEDWIFTANWWARSGLPLRVGVAEETPFGWQFVRASRVDGVAKFIGVGLDRRLNRGAYSLPSQGLNGNLRRGDVRGFAFGQLDFEVRRVLRFSSRLTLDLSTQMRNLTNAVNRVDPRGNLAYRFSDGQLLNDNLFGTSLQTAGTRDFSPFYFYGGPRNLIFTARFSF